MLPLLRKFAQHTTFTSFMLTTIFSNIFCGLNYANVSFIHIYSPSISGKFQSFGGNRNASLNMQSIPLSNAQSLQFSCFSQYCIIALAFLIAAISVSLHCSTTSFTFTPRFRIPSFLPRTLGKRCIYIYASLPIVCPALRQSEGTPTESRSYRKTSSRFCMLL